MYLSINDLCILFHLLSEDQYITTLPTMNEKWSAHFFDYFQTNINLDYHATARWAIGQYGIYNPFSGTTNNQSESINCVNKQLQNWHEVPLDCMALSLYYLQNYYMMGIYRGQHGIGS